MTNSLIKSLRIGAAVLGFAWCGVAAQAAEGDATRAISKNSMCIGCHSIPGYKASFPAVYNVPKLGGQSASYIVAALQAYKKGDRNHPTMKAIAEGLSEQDMADLAAYYSASSATH